MPSSNTAYNPLGSEKESTLLLRYTIPCIISMLVSALYNIVDQIFIGIGVGMLGNAATNIAFPLTAVCLSLALLLGIGGASRMSLMLGQGKKDEASKIAGNAVILMLISGVTLSAAVLIFLDPLLMLFGSTHEILPYARTYTGFTAIGFPFLIVNTSLSKLIISDGSPKYAMFSLLAGAVINTILDPLFIFVFDWGMTGAALATVIGQVSSCIITLLYIKRFRQVSLTKDSFRLSLKHSLSILALGISPALNQAAMAIVQIVMNNSLKHYGGLSGYGSEIPIACSGVIAKVSMVFFAVIIGIAQGQQPILGFNYGAEKYGRVRKTFMMSLCAATAVSVIMFIIFQAFPRQITAVFGKGDELYFEFAEKYIRIFMFMTFINGIQPIAANMFTSIGKPQLGMFTTLTRQILFLLPLIIILPLFGGIDGIIYAGPAADALAAVVCGICLLREFRELTRKESGMRNSCQNKA